ncbi:MAG: hypothetical protein FJW90_03995 [Actinobacteria bacterium]|nr:hypothetical protein [Actinomycetota bacterium]
MALFSKDDRPLLAVDVDGVISLFGYERPTDDAPGEFHLVDGMLHCISMPTGPRLNRLAKTYQLVWASGWEDRANDYLPGILGVPSLPYLTFDGEARFGSAHWKLAALEAYSGERPLAWIDDSLDPSCYDWADARPAPTLLVPTDPGVGLEEGHVAALESWARTGYSPR